MTAKLEWESGVQREKCALIGYSKPAEHAKPGGKSGENCNSTSIYAVTGLTWNVRRWRPFFSHTVCCLALTWEPLVLSLSFCWSSWNTYSREWLLSVFAILFSKTNFCIFIKLYLFCVEFSLIWNFVFFFRYYFNILIERYPWSKP